MMKKIAIIGTRGIPNRYGGFERFAEKLSINLVKKKYSVTVYNPDYHPYKDNIFQGVTIRKKNLPEFLIGASANIYYDYVCMKDAIRNGNDIVLACGYGSMLAAIQIKRKKTKLIVNMDGMEWQRRKWHSLVKSVLHISEKQTVKKADMLVTDHKEINSYYKVKYGINNPCIPYGADIPDTFNVNLLRQFGLSSGNYYLIISRPISENNLTNIIRGFILSSAKEYLIIVTNINDRYAKHLKSKYKDPRLLYLSNIYDQNMLNSLRYFSKAYFHGHSVGGTNPSLLEAMAAQCFIIAHDNAFNRNILENNVLYFRTEADIVFLINNLDGLLSKKKASIQNNLEKIKTQYTWENVTQQYIRLLETNL